MDAAPAIHRAAASNNVEEVLRLIYQDPQVINSTDKHGYTALHYACEGGHVSVVAALVDHGADIDHLGNDRFTVLYWACLEGHVAVVELLLEKGANPVVAGCSGWNPLMIASLKGRVAVVRRLLHHPSVLSTINHCDNHGWTALYVACREGHSDIVKVLLEAGADPTITSNDGTAAMDIATEEGNQECVSLLKEWDRSYTITKARLLYDAFCRYQDRHQQRGQQEDNDGASVAPSIDSGVNQASSGSNQRPEIEAAIPTYLKGRVEGEQPLPKVEMVDGYEEGSLVKSVLEYVICGGLKGELFVELMAMMGKTGARKEEEDTA